MLRLLLWPFWLAGWVLGIVGFFHARSALNEVARLRRELARTPAPPVAAAGPAVLATLIEQLPASERTGPPGQPAAPMPRQPELPPPGRAPLVLHFAEAALHVASLAVLAIVTMRIAMRLDRPVLHWGWRIQGALATTGGALLILLNPILTGEPVGLTPLLDWLLPAYLLPACLAWFALRQPATVQPPWLRRMLAGYALVAEFAWITLEVRHLFHPAAMRMPAVPVTDAELWAWSGAWLRPYWTRSHKAPTDDRSETPTQSVRLPTNRIDRDPFERPFSLTPKDVRRKEITMRTLVPPPPSQHCDICRGELRLKEIEPVEPLFLELDIEIFVCTKCGHEQSHRVSHDHYAAHTASNVSHARMG